MKTTIWRGISSTDPSKLAHGSALDEPSTRLEQKYKTGSYLEDKKSTGTHGGEILREVSSDVHDSVISEISSPDSYSASISEDQSEQQSTAEIMEEGMTLEDRETNMSRSSMEQETGLCRLNETMAISVRDFDSQQAIESASCGEIQVVHEMNTLTGAENLSAEPRGIESSSSTTERSKHHDESITSEVNMPFTISVTGEMSKFVDNEQEILHPSSSKEMHCSYNDFVPKKEHYLVSMKDNLIKLKLDDQTILIGECPSSGPLESSPVINLVEQDLRELPEKPNYHNSLLLFLQRNNRLTHIHTSFFTSMLDLHFLDLSDTRIKILPSSLFRLSKLKVLMLRNCVCLEKLPSDIGELNHMEVLDLSGTELYNLPDEIGQLMCLRHLQLSFYGPDDDSEYVHLPSELISHTVLSKLKALEALSIIVHPEDHRWTKIAACIMKDVGCLEMLSFIQFYSPEVEMFEDFIQMSPSWKEHRMRKFKFIVGHNVKRIVSRVPEEVESLYHQQDKCLRFVNADKVPQVIKTVLLHVRAFYLDHHLQILSLSEFDISNFKELKFCVVTECPKVQVIIDEESSENAFSCLEHLRVYYLWELKRIWKIPAPSGNFHALKYLIVNTCPKLQFILWESMLQCLSNLEEIVVEDCASVEKIVEEEKDIVNNNAIMLPGLRKLVLRYLPKLVSLGNGLCLSEGKISTYGCPKLILNSQPKKQRRIKQKKFLGSLRGCGICI